MTEPDEAFARCHGYRLVEMRYGWRIQTPRQHAKSEISGEYYANANEAWRQAALRIRWTLACAKPIAGRRRGWKT